MSIRRRKLDMYVDSSACIEAAQLDHALLYATEFGWRVLPCHSARNGRCTCKLGTDCPSTDAAKHPRPTHGIRDADDRPEVIRKWWDRWPSANVAIATGRGLVVIDVDP